MRKKLNDLLTLAKTSLTGRKVACVIVDTDGKRYLGYNIETEQGIIHAEVNALNNSQNFFTIDSIHLMSGGNFIDIKHTIPCESCSKLLSFYTSKNSKAVFYTHNPDLKFEINLNEIINAYSPNHKSLVCRSDINLSLNKNTYLTKIDRLMTINICEQIKNYSKLTNNKVHVYLTGSSIKGCGPKHLLAKKIFGIPYFDLDFLFIFPEKYPEDVNSFIKEVYQKALRFIGWKNIEIFDQDKLSYVLEEKEKKMDDDEFLFRKIYWVEGMMLEDSLKDIKKSSNIPSPLDLSVGQNLKSTITNKYFEKSWFIQLV